MRLLAIDPGTHQGWAHFESGRLVACGLGAAPDMVCQKVIIELPEYRPGSRVSPNDLISLAVKVGLAAARHYDVVEFVKPSKWKGSVPKEIHGRRIVAKLDADEVYELGLAKCPGSKLNNIVDAVGLGLWWLKR